MHTPVRHTIWLVLETRRGATRAARGVAAGAIRKALKIDKWGAAPHHVCYISREAARCAGLGKGDPRYAMSVTGAELERLREQLDRLSAARGWSRQPFGLYNG